MFDQPSRAEPGSLTDRVYRALREWILISDFRSGSLLTERELARRLEVSKTPVREALIRLGQEGFVEISPRRGIRVSSVSVQDLKEVFGIRSALEGLAAETAAGCIPRHVLVELRRQFRQAARAKDDERLFELGARLHDLTIEACGNRRLASIVDTIRAQIARYSRLASRLPEQARQSLRDHLRILRALERRDPVGARRAVEQHIRDVKENLVRSML